MDRRTRRSPGRFLAPLALIAVIVALLSIISSSNNSSGSSGDSTTTPAAQTTTTSKKSTTTKSKSKSTKSGTTRVKATYTVKVGDTLGAIAAKTGVSLTRIQELNPNVDPHAMVAGQQIRLK
jgi:LysM repeat protein